MRWRELRGGLRDALAPNGVLRWGLRCGHCAVRGSQPPEGSPRRGDVVGADTTSMRRVEQRRHGGTVVQEAADVNLGRGVQMYSSMDPACPWSSTGSTNTALDVARYRHRGQRNEQQGGRQTANEDNALSKLSQLPPLLLTQVSSFSCCQFVKLFLCRQLDGQD